MKKKRIPVINKFSNLLIFFQHENLLSFIIEFSKSNLFNAAFSGWITVVSIEVFTLCSGDFGIAALDSSEFFTYIVFVPIIAVSIMEFIYGLFYILLIFFKIPKVKRDLDELIVLKGMKYAENYLTNKYHKITRNFCIFGTIMYLLAGIISPCLLIWLNLRTDNFILFIIVVAVMATVLGGIWNLTGYARVNRIAWWVIYPNFNKSRIKKESLKALIRQVAWEAIGLILSILIFLYGIMRFNMCHNNISDTALTFYNMIFVVYGALISIFIRHFVKCINSPQERYATVYPSLKCVTSDKP